MSAHASSDQRAWVRFRSGGAGRALAALAATVLSTSVSCSLFTGFIKEEREPVAAPVVEMLAGPTAVDWVEGHFTQYYTRLAPFEIRAVAETIVAESRERGIDLELILSLIRTESGFNNFATSHVGALGLMQVMPHTGKAVAEKLGIEWRGSETLFHPVTNVRIGTAYLDWLHSRYAGSWDKALAAYNWGPTRIDYRLARGRALPDVYFQKVLADRSIFVGS
jgi:soluble lytic murein transglycosylase-like protein